MKIYRNLAEAVVGALQTIFEEGKLANRTVESLLRSNKKWGGRDRRFIASQIYEVVRWYRYYYEMALGHEPKGSAQWWQILAAKWHLEGIELPEWDEIAGFDIAALEERKAKSGQIRAVKESIPEWMDQVAAAELGEELWSETLSALNEQAGLVLRCNTLKRRRVDLIKGLAKEGVVATPLGEDNALLVDQNPNLQQSKSYLDGLFEVQDNSSQQVAKLLNPTPGSVVIDACAGAGGKSLHIAALMENKGKLIALDVEDYKLKELETRAQRASVRILQTELLEANQPVPSQFIAAADYLLLDVPCTGMGVLRRNPDSKWKLTPEFLEEIQKTQRNIISQYSAMLKKGGKMVYATCSILPSENEKQVGWFLASEMGKDFKLVEQKSILPQNAQFDGFYMALLERN